jgi:2-polyprenyl-3-methyl-5-hydroxy-6-metoxy-1,4-benzoquinol methylase
MNYLENLVVDGRLRLDVLQRLCEQPQPFAPGAELFWDDPYIAQQMLAAHLDPATDAASREPHTIDRTVAWLISYLDLCPGTTVLDLGCGPGLYCERLARHGLTVTGIDYSHNSIAYATQHAASAGLAIDYVCGNYVDVPYPQQMDAILMIYGDLCVLAPEQRNQVLRKARGALRAGGHFVFDVT